MRILITNHSLASLTGSELFVRDIALALKARGHEVGVFAPRVGELAEELKTRGILVANRLGQLPKPDLIHGQHHLPTMAALCAWPDLRAVYLCHGFRPWEERVPLHPRIRAYAAISPKLMPWIRNVCQLGDTEITWLPNFVDTERFSKVRSPGRKPLKALVFSNRTQPGSSFEAIRTACLQYGMELDACGTHFGKVTTTPERKLPGYDVVFATGRSALEALASGCAVICQVDDRLGPLITPENFAIYREKNFSIPVGTKAFDAEEVLAQLGQFDAERVKQISQLVRQQCSLNTFIDELLLPWYQSALEKQDPQEECTIMTEAQAMATYLTHLDQYLHHGDLHFEKLRQDGLRQKFIWPNAKANWENRAGNVAMTRSLLN